MDGVDCDIRKLQLGDDGADEDGVARRSQLVDDRHGRNEVTSDPSSLGLRPRLQLVSGSSFKPHSYETVVHQCQSMPWRPFPNLPAPR